jgi:hypothetical protein
MFKKLFARKQEYTDNPPTSKAGELFVKKFVCEGCRTEPANTITLKCDKNREDGPSNFEGFHTAKTLRKYKLDDIYLGHSILASGDLNWLGLLEERNWEVSPKIKCPACIHGMHVTEYKQARRDGKI